MSNEVIATVRLAQGRVGFYDELSRIHLSLGAPTAHVYSGTNCARLRRAVKSGIIRLVNGSLGNDVPPFKVVEVNGKYKLASNKAEEMKPVVKEDIVASETKAEETAVEEKVYESTEEIATIETPAENEATETESEEVVAESVEETASEEKKTSTKKTRKNRKSTVTE